MKKRDWKRSLAFVCATALIAGSLSPYGPLTRVKAEETNLFTDGDMGDDEMGDSTDAADFGRIKIGILKEIPGIAQVR